MAHNYINTPGTEFGNTFVSPDKHVLDMSFAQPFASPSKNPAQDLRNQMRGLRGAPPQSTKTPRPRTALLDKRNPGAKQEFTPLLKSAKRNQLMRQSILEEKENTDSGTLKTPAGLRMSYGSKATPGLPVEASMLEDYTGSSGDRDATPMAPAAVSSSMIDSTPIPQLPDRNKGGVLDQGNVLTLRDQEAKLDQIQKDNFGLKLKIHFLEEALRKSGNEFHQQTVKENVDLKTNKAELEVDLKKQRKRLEAAEHQLEEYKVYLREYQEKVKKRHANERDQEELDRLQKMAEESQKIADEREQELEEMREKLDRAEQFQSGEDEAQRLKERLDDVEQELRDRDRELDEKDAQLEDMQDKLDSAASAQSNNEELQELKDDIHRLEQEQRDRDRQLDEKDEKLGRLEDEMKVLKADTEHLDAMQKDIQDMEAEIQEKDDELARKNERLTEMEERVSSTFDREQSTKKLRGDMAALEVQLREKDQALDEARQQLRAEEKRLEFADSGHKAQLRQREDEMHNAQRELADKDGEIRALQERLSTARGSWDNEAQQADMRIQEKDRIIREKEATLREKSRVIEERDDELADLEKRMRAAENMRDEAVRIQSHRATELHGQVGELEERLRVATATSQAKLNEKNGLIEARENEMQSLQNRLTTLQSGDSAEVRKKNEYIQHLEADLKAKERESKDQSQQITSLKSRLGAMETPSKKDSLIKQQAEQVRSLQQQVQQLEGDKDAEIDELDSHLRTMETTNSELEKRIQILQKRTEAADRDQSLLGHQGNNLQAKDEQISALEYELDQLRTKLQSAIDQRQRDVRQLELELETAHASGKGDAERIQRRLESTKADLEAKHREALQDLKDELTVLEAENDRLNDERANLEVRIHELESNLQQARRAKENGTPVRERNELRLKLKTVETEREALKVTIKDLEAELDGALQSRSDGTPVRERNELRGKLREAETKAIRLQDKVKTLESELEFVQQERTIAEERQDLHDLLKAAKIEAEQAQMELAKRDKKESSTKRKEGELRTQLENALAEAEEFQQQATELEQQLQAATSKEREQRAQLKSLKTAKTQLEELEVQLQDRNGSSSGHARREAELRSQLRDSKAEAERLNLDVVEKDDRLQTALRKEQELRERLRKARADDTFQLNKQDLQAQLDDADLECQALQDQLREYHNKLQASVKREEELRLKIKSLRSAHDHARSVDEKAETRHQGELKGLSKQIQYLRAKCTREESFRADLVFVKKWFLMQVEMYNACNQADLRLLEEIGITPDYSFREKKHSLRTVGLAVVATIRMQKMSQSWAGSKKLHETLLRKLEGMKRKATPGKGAGAR